MDIEKRAIERLQFGAEVSKRLYRAPLIICYSGGKDSDALLQLAINSGIEFEVLHSHTTVDAPETVYHIRDTFKRLEEKGIKCTVEYPKYKGSPVTMWSLIPQKKMPPTRIVRYCCSVLKEQGGQHRAISTGVRWGESKARSQRGIFEGIAHSKEKRIILNNDNDDKRRWVERCERQAKTVVNPIIDWQEEDVWEYLKYNHTSYNPLYCDGFSRIGCIGCPMAGTKRYAEFRRYPAYERAYIRAFDKMLEVRKQNRMTWENGYDVFRWWMGEDFTQFEFADLKGE